MERRTNFMKAFDPIFSSATPTSKPPAKVSSMSAAMDAALAKRRTRKQAAKVISKTKQRKFTAMAKEQNIFRNKNALLYNFQKK